MANTKVKAEQLEAAQTNITSVGTLTALTVDDITIDGSTISDGGDLTLDVGGDITLDAGGNEIKLKTGGTEWGQLYNSSSDLAIYSSVQDKDIKFQGNDGGSTVTALTLDMSDAGAATFNAGATFGGSVGIGSGSGTTASAGYDELVIQGGNADIGMAFLSPAANNKTQTIAFGDSNNNSSGKITYNHSTDAMAFNTAAQERMRITSAGKVSIASTSTAAQLNVYESSNSQMQFQTSATGTGASDGARFGYNGSGAQVWNFENNYVRFATNNTERVRITDDGKVGINDTAPPRSLSIIGVDGAYSGQTSGNSRTHILLENNGGNYIEFINPSGSSCGLMFSTNTAQNRGSIQYSSDALYLTQGGYDRAIIRPDGAFQTSDTNALVDFDSGGNRVRNGSLWGYTLRHEGTGNNPHGFLCYYASAAPDGSSSYPFYFTDSGAARFYVSSNGNIWTSDYGAITSDETLKENIVDATPKLADIMKLKVRNFNWKKSYHPNESEEKMLGFIAQEFEQVFPRLIKETDIAPKVSAKGDDEDHVPDMKKSVVQGALIPALVKAMQEQQALIETLQTKVAALEAK